MAVGVTAAGITAVGAISKEPLASSADDCPLILLRSPPETRETIKMCAWQVYAVAPSRGKEHRAIGV